MKRHGISLRLSVTEGCQLRCCYCRPAEGGDPACGEKPLEDRELTMLVVHLHAAAGIDKLRFTGGEPLLRRGLPELVAGCARLEIGDLALTTNGLRLGELARDLKRSGLRRVNVSLDSLDEDTFSRISRGGDLGSCLAGIEAALSAGLRPVKLNMVVMRDLNDHEVYDMLAFALDTGCHIRFLELMPTGEGAHDFAQRFVGWKETHGRLTADHNLRPLPYTPGATSRDFEARDSQGRSTICGFISPSSQPFCGGCNRLRLTADGRLMGCLAVRRHIDLRPPLEEALQGNPLPLMAAIEEAFLMKRDRHDLTARHDMARIGG